jgi:hypothetical protein
MNWNAIGAIGQIMGSLATFVTVALLAVQIHDSEDAVRRAIAQTRAERDMQMLLQVANNEHLGALDVKLALFAANKTDLHPLAKTTTVGAIGSFITVAQQADLTIAEAFALNSYYVARWTNMAETIIHLDETLPVDREQFDIGVRAGVSDPAFRFWYQTFKPTLHPLAVRYTDNLLAQPG